jgi:hypothetical protein
LNAPGVFAAEIMNPSRSYCEKSWSVCVDSVIRPEIGSASSLWKACFSRAIDSVSPMNGITAGKIFTWSGLRPASLTRALMSS